ncbi:hypothetical protein N9X24_03620, partial [Rickettsiales bacterium]|nr:hypothetical protein [Rickettsiales bacterium]
NKAKTIAAKKDARGILVSGIDREDAIKCRLGTVLNNGICEDAILSFGVDGNDNLPNFVNHASTITYNPNITTLSKADFACNIGYQDDSNAAQYWFENNGGTFNVKTIGECESRNYESEFIAAFGASDLADLTNNYYVDPSAISYNATYNSSGSLGALPCDSSEGYGSESSLDGYYFDTSTGDITIIQNNSGCSYVGFVLPVTDQLVVHLDAMDIDGDGDVNDNPSDGANISQWNDKTGNNYHFVLHTVGSGFPTMDVDGINGKPAIQITNKFFRNDSITLGNNKTIYVVSKYNSRDGATRFLLMNVRGIAGQTQRHVVQNTGSTTGFYFRKSDSGWIYHDNYTPQSDGIGVNQPFMVSLHYSDTNPSTIKFGNTTFETLSPVGVSETWTDTTYTISIN